MTNIFNHTPIKLPERNLKSVDSDNGRIYYDENNTKYYSVTSVVNIHSKEFFKEWSKKEENRKKSTYAASRGTGFHTIIENYLNNNPNFLDTSKNIFSKTLFNNVKPELSKINNIVCQEGVLWSDTMKMAGRVDCIAEYTGKLSVIDFKTSEKPKNKEWIKNYFEQTTAYSIMFKELTKVRIDNIVIIIANDCGSYQVFEENPKDWVKPLSETIKKFFSELK